MRNFLTGKNIREMLNRGIMLAKLKDDKRLPRLKKLLHQLDQNDFSRLAAETQNYNSSRQESQPLVKEHKEIRIAPVHDKFFNHKRKAAYETHLAQLFMTNLTPFMEVIKKVSDTILPDLTFRTLA